MESIHRIYVIIKTTVDNIFQNTSIEELNWIKKSDFNSKTMESYGETSFGNIWFGMGTDDVDKNILHTNFIIRSRYKFNPKDCSLTELQETIKFPFIEYKSTDQCLHNLFKSMINSYLNNSTFSCFNRTNGHIKKARNIINSKHIFKPIY